MKKSFYQRALAWVLTAGMLTTTLSSSFAAETQISASDPMPTIETYVPEEGQDRISVLSSALESSEIATATLSSTTCPGCSTGHNGWTAITSGGTYTGSGNYYLSDNVKGDLIFTGDGENSTTINFCLNDKTLTGSGTNSAVYLENLTFNLYGGGGGLLLKNSDFTMNGGSINNNSSSIGGGISLNDTIFRMNGGEIKNNSATQGGGMYVTQESLVEMYGGEISHNFAELQDTQSCSGGGIAVTYSEFTIFGGKISNNTAVSAEAILS